MYYMVWDFKYKTLMHTGFSLYGLEDSVFMTSEGHGYSLEDIREQKERFTIIKTKSEPIIEE